MIENGDTGERVFGAARCVCEWLDFGEKIVRESRAPDATPSHILVDRNDLVTLRRALQSHPEGA